MAQDSTKPTRRGKYCVAFGCSSTNNDQVSLHEFPKEDAIRRQWINFVKCKRKDFVKPSKQSVLCERHFQKSSYPVEYELKKQMNIPVKRKLLLPQAVPSIHSIDKPLESPGAPMLTSTPFHDKGMSPPKKLRTAFRKRECARVIFEHTEEINKASGSDHIFKEKENFPPEMDLRENDTLNVVKNNSCSTPLQ